MPGRRVARTAAVAVGLALLVAAPAVAVPATALAQEQCVPPGELIAPVPWSQRMVAPERAWPLSTGSGQRVAVVGTGVADAPQLAGTLAARTDLAPAPDFGDPSGALDCLGIGTGVAGIVAAQPADGVGFHGMAPDARILAAKVVGDRYPREREPVGSVSPGVLASAIDWAIDRAATVITVPTITYEDTTSLRAAVERAITNDIVVVAAVGDAGEGTSGQLPGTPYPAAYPGVISVGAIAEDVSAATSHPSIDLVAPGMEVVTAYPGSGLGPANGSGFAAAYVAGAATLLRSYEPELSQGEVAHRLFATTTPAPEGVGSSRYGYGIVNAYQALADRVVGGDPAELPPYRPGGASAEEFARASAQASSDSVAIRLAGAGLVLAAVLAAAVGFGVRGRRRRWRSGLAVAPRDVPLSGHPAAPIDLFADRGRK